MADEAFQRRLLNEIGRAARRKVRPLIRTYKGKPIRQLQRALRLVLVSDDKAVLRIPHYWAVYVHDGRNAPFGPRTSVFLIWWKDPRQDPRLSGGQTPERASQLRSLTPDEFRDAVQARDDALRAGRESPVVITRRVRRQTPPSRFFGNGPGEGMAGFVVEANRIGQQEFKRFALNLLKNELGVTSFVPFVPAGSGISFKVVKENADIVL